MRILVLVSLTTALGCTIPGSPGTSTPPPSAGPGIKVDQGNAGGSTISVDPTTADAAKLGGTPAASFQTTSQADAKYLGIGAQVIVNNGPFQISVNGVFCGITGAMTGAFTDPTGSGATGYRAAKLACQQVSNCGPSATAHMCDASEIVRSAQLGVLPGSLATSGVYWTSSFTSAADPRTNPVTFISDCFGWTQSVANYSASVVKVYASPALIRPDYQTCDQSFPIACCK